VTDNNRLFKVQYITDYFFKKFRETFNPGQKYFDRRRYDTMTWTTEF